MSAPFFVFVVFSSLQANLLLQCALGLKSDQNQNSLSARSTGIKLAAVFACSLLLWVVFEFLLFFLPGGLFLYALAFPIGVLAFDGLDFLIYRFVLKTEDSGGAHVGFCGALSAASLFISLNSAGGILAAVFLSFGFVLGVFLAVMILHEIRRRAALEAVPSFLRGNPLLLISMGLLSAVFYAVSLLLFRIPGG